LIEHRIWVKPVEQNDPALKNGVLLFSELAERTQTTGHNQGIGDRVASGVTRNGQTAVLSEHSSEGATRLTFRVGLVGGEVRPKRAAVAKVKSGVTIVWKALW